MGKGPEGIRAPFFISAYEGLSFLGLAHGRGSTATGLLIALGPFVLLCPSLAALPLKTLPCLGYYPRAQGLPLLPRKGRLAGSCLPRLMQTAEGRAANFH